MPIGRAPSISVRLTAATVENRSTQAVARQGELASGKLMIPMLIMFAGILVMVLVPVFSNLGL